MSSERRGGSKKQREKALDMEASRHTLSGKLVKLSYQVQLYRGDRPAV